MGHFADQHEVAVDPGAAVLQARCHLHGLVEVLRPDRRGQAVFRVVGPVHDLRQFIKTGDGHHRPKHFALDDFIALFATGQQRRLVIEARPRMRSAPRHTFNVRLAQRPLDKTGHAITLTGADQRADFVIGIALAGKADTAHRITQRRHQLVVNTGLRIHPARRGAILPRVVIAIRAHPFDHGLKVGIVADDHRRFAAQFKVGALEGFGRGGEDFLPGDDIAGQ